MISFGTVDYMIIAIYLIGVVVLGLIFSRRQNTLREFYQASGDVPWWAAGASMMATELSTITYLAAPGWIFLKDTRFSMIVFFNLVLVPISVVIWRPLWTRLRVISVYEYLEARFHPLLRAVGAVLYLFNQII